MDWESTSTQTIAQNFKMLARIAVFVSLLALCKGESYALEEEEIDLEKRSVGKKL